MADLTKYEMFLNDLSSLETQTVILTGKCKNLSLNNKKLEEELSRLKKENRELAEKIDKLELHIPDSPELFPAMSRTEREEMKFKLQSLITKIDYHLSSER
jgi:predicted nuclease with TOPRIM domain